ncbi:unnamed protein product [Moneuplotes crassus]|uniref:Uncharacterized protein n=1 Tax=Euplotes crassus TaxID=5936 RepID=A0AAD1XCS3_EUPCR|nr:unnamed protein product [Moneuplotes crassus]
MCAQEIKIFSGVDINFLEDHSDEELGIGVKVPFEAYYQGSECKEIGEAEELKIISKLELYSVIIYTILVKSFRLVPNGYFEDDPVQTVTNLQDKRSTWLDLDEGVASFRFEVPFNSSDVGLLFLKISDLNQKSLSIYFLLSDDDELKDISIPYLNPSFSDLQKIYQSILFKLNRVLYSGYTSKSGFYSVSFKRPEFNKGEKLCKTCLGTGKVRDCRGKEGEERKESKVDGYIRQSYGI